MEIISTNKQLEKQLLRLIDTYPKMAFATAWASAKTGVFERVVEEKSKIVGAVIGTHFYQTHPDVLGHFVNSKKVKFALQPEGVFHPKVYIFWDKSSWEVIIGSANLTAGALSVNSELSTLISHQDGTPNLKDKLVGILEDYLNNARTISKNDVYNYRSLWDSKQQDLARISGQYGSGKSKKLAIDSSVMSMNWSTFVTRVKQDKTHGFDERINMLTAVQAQFDKHAHFNDMTLDIRRGIAGLKSDFFPNWGWFGSMKGAGTFRRLINKSDPAFSKALEQIPLQKDVTKVHFDRYIFEFLKAFPDGYAGMATATRLLAMKRPDTFVCVASANELLCEDIGISPSSLTYGRYWEEVILRLKDSPWWQSPEPNKPKEKALWQCRAAMLDAIFFKKKIKAN